MRVCMRENNHFKTVTVWNVNTFPSVFLTTPTTLWLARQHRVLGVDAMKERVGLLVHNLKLF